MTRANPRGLPALAATLAAIWWFGPSLAAQASAPANAPAARRAAWLSDRPSLQVGDLITVLVEEQALALERTDRLARSDREQRAQVSLDVNGSLVPSSVPSAGELATALEASSRQNGTHARQGQLSAIVTVRVTRVEAGGWLRVEGQRTVIIDKREQRLSVSGLIRPEDVGPDYLVSSARLAEARISYQGKGIGPSKGLLGRILSMFWP
jgi:flagellar L-ring protein precursor FlgH